MKQTPRMFLVFLCLVFVCPVQPAQAGLVLATIGTDHARYSPRAVVRFSLALENHTGHAIQKGTLRLLCTHLGMPLDGPLPQTFRLAPNAGTTLVFRWNPPAQDFHGYLVEASVRDAAGQLLDSGSTAVDVSSVWTKFPRYGFLSHFPAQSARTSSDVVRHLNGYHLNGLQFYDWQYKHHLPLAGTAAAPAASWNDLANRPTFRRTLLDLIAASHQFGMATMNYNLLYGAWSGYDRDGVDYRWGLWKNKDDTNKDGTNQDSVPLPSGWATPSLHRFNPGAPGWQRFLIGQEAQVFAAYPFDGWQMDQLGDRGPEYDQSGRPVTVWQQFRPFLNQAKSVLKKTLIFNNVAAYGLYDTAAHSTGDIVYIECWEFGGQKTYNDLKIVIDQASAWSGGKGVVLAAYMNRAYADQFSASRPGRFNQPAVLLTDAVIFASGGAHIELGDDDQMLDNEYFPNRNLTMPAGLKSAVHGYYDFLTAYQNLLRGGLQNSDNAIVLPALPTSADASPNTVWAFAKTGSGCQVLHLINLLGEKNVAWRDDHADYPVPTLQANILVKYHLGKRTVKGLRWATPDKRNGASAPLLFQTGADKRGRYVQFTIPSLAYWDMIYLSDGPLPLPYIKSVPVMKGRTIRLQSSSGKLRRGWGITALGRSDELISH